MQKHAYDIHISYLGSDVCSSNLLTDNVRDETPDKPAVWTKTAGQDHYFHSMALNMLARRVNEHAYSLNKETTLVSIACAGAMVGSGANDNLLGTGAERISRLG